MRRFVVLSALITLTAVPAPLWSADLSDDALMQLFLHQRDAFRAAQSSGTGKTRGLTLVTIDAVDVGADAPTLAVPAAGDQAGSVTASADGTVVGTAPALSQPAGADATATADTAVTVASATDQTKPQVFGVLDQELQVNVNIRFGFDSAALTPDQKPLLTQLCSVMRKSDIGLFQIVGHTDASGTDAYNQRLSQLRAQEVERFFVSDCGIDAGRLKAVGMGEKFLANGKDPKGPENRRVEFQALS